MNTIKVSKKPLNRLAKIRRTLFLTVNEFSELLSVKPQNITQYENNKCMVPIPIAKHILNIISEFGINMTLDEFYEDIKPYNAETRSKRQTEICSQRRPSDYFIQRLREIDDEARNRDGGNQHAVCDDSEDAEDDEEGVCGSV